MRNKDRIKKNNNSKSGLLGERCYITFQVPAAHRHLNVLWAAPRDKTPG